LIIFVAVLVSQLSSQSDPAANRVRSGWPAGRPEFFWAHDDTGTVAQQVTMTCRPGTNSYRVLMQVYGLASAGELNDEDEPEAAGVELDNEAETGPVIKLTC
jgi:hypothetical protein